MPTCLLGLGSNLGNREATLRAAIEEINALPNLRLVRSSSFFHTPAVGGQAGQAEYLNAAAVVDTTIPPLTLLEHLQRIETRHGRQRNERWEARTLDIDLLLYGDEVVETASLIVPHLRMAYRRFVLEPAAEIAAKMIHPVIGWPIERLLLHLNAARDELVVMSPSESVRVGLATPLAEKLGVRVIDPPTFKTAEQLWPAAYSTWLEVSPASIGRTATAPNRQGLAYAAAAFPKLTVILDSPGSGPTASKALWSGIVRQPGRGPLLRLQEYDQVTLQLEVFSAVEAIWPDLCPSPANRLE